MADKGALRVYTELPQWAKGVVVVGGLVVGYLAVTSIIKAIKSKKTKEESLAEVNNAATELNTQIKSGKGPTIQRSTAEVMSNAIVAASNDCGTDEKQIYAQFDKVKNQADILLFVDVFGLRKKVRCPFSDDPRESTLLFGLVEASFSSSYTPPMSLSAMINGELDATEIATINNKLATKGIKYKF
jgi:hypothetical protein